MSARDLLGYMVVRDEDGKVVADWDAEAHASYEDAETELIKCQAAVTSYRWFLVELRRAEVSH